MLRLPKCIPSLNFVRGYSARVRMAPSPTGKFHLGGLRTSLFNYLFAKKTGGTFIVRIEDTDQTRLDPVAEDDIKKCLEWAGMSPDEGWDKGEFGPYKQSLRAPIYKEYAHQLVNSGHAYRCYCTSERLEAMRMTYAKKGLPSFYDRACLSLPINHKASGQPAPQNPPPEDDQPYTIRFKVPEGETIVHDYVLGEVPFENKVIDDQVLLKSDGFPTYHLANVVDDYLMKISHVIRGEEWLPSTPKHIMLYRAFGWPEPKWVHLPLLLNTDRTKLSKRKGDVSVSSYIDNGFLPTALINFVALLGWNPGQHDYQEVFFTFQELVDKFSLETINSSAAVVDINKLIHINGQHMQHQLKINPQSMVQLFKKEITEISASQNLSLNPNLIKEDYLLQCLQSIQHEFETTRRTVDKYRYFFFDPDFSTEEANQFIGGLKDKTQTGRVLTQLVEGQDQWTTVPEIKAIFQKEGMPASSAFQLVRLAVTGKPSGMDLKILLSVIPRDVLLDRLARLRDILLKE